MPPSYSGPGDHRDGSTPRDQRTWLEEWERTPSEGFNPVRPLGAGRPPVVQLNQNRLTDIPSAAQIDTAHSSSSSSSSVQQPPDPLTSTLVHSHESSSRLIAVESIQSENGSVLGTDPPGLTASDSSEMDESVRTGEPYQGARQMDPDSFELADSHGSVAGGTVSAASQVYPVSLDTSAPTISGRSVSSRAPIQGTGLMEPDHAVLEDENCNNHSPRWPCPFGCDGCKWSTIVETALDAQRWKSHCLLVHANKSVNGRHPAFALCGICGEATRPAGDFGAWDLNLNHIATHYQNGQFVLSVQLAKGFFKNVWKWRIISENTYMNLVRNENLHIYTQMNSNRDRRGKSKIPG